MHVPVVTRRSYAQTHVPASPLADCPPLSVVADSYVLQWTNTTQQPANRLWYAQVALRLSSRVIASQTTVQVVLLASHRNLGLSLVV